MSEKYRDIHRETNVLEVKIQLLKEVVIHSEDKIDQYYNEIERYSQRVTDTMDEIASLESEIFKRDN